MADTTKIEWASRTFSPWIGCTKVHSGCENCYAEEQFGTRFGVTWGPKGVRRKTAGSSWAKVLTWDRVAERGGYQDRVFPSLCDVFEEWGGDIVNQFGNPVYFCELCGAMNDCGTVVARTEEPMCGICDRTRCRKLTMDQLRDQFFKLIRMTRSLTWILLTKRPHLALEFFARNEQKWDNVWLLYSASEQQHIDKHWIDVASCKRFVKYVGFCLEPLLGPIQVINGNANRYSQPTAYWRGTGVEWTDPGALFCPVDWVIVGGESGGNARECELGWIGDIVTDCSMADVPCFVKQLGANAVYRKPPARGCLRYHTRHDKGGDSSEWPMHLRVQQFPQWW